MHKLSDKDKKIWNYYISNLKSITKVDKNKKINSNTISAIDKVLKPTFNFTLDSKIKKLVKIILSGLQETKFPISYDEQNEVANDYLKIIKKDTITNKNIKNIKN